MSESSDAIVAALLRLGWVEDGRTRSETVRVPTIGNPCFGGIGGEIRTFGGRVRYLLPATAWRITVGPRTTCLYKKTKGSAEGCQNESTKVVAAVGVEAFLLDKVPAEALRDAILPEET
jgi:hypothetical protein